MGFEIYEARGVKTNRLTLAAGNGTNYATLVDSAGPITRPIAIAIVNSTAAAKVIELDYSVAGGHIKSARSTVPASAGDGTVPAFDLLADLAAQGLPTFLIGAADVLSVNMVVALTGGDELRFLATSLTF